MKLTIGTRIALGYALAILVIVAVGAVSYSSVNKLLAAAKWVEHTHLVINKIDAVALDIVEIETGQRGYALTGDESRLRPYFKGLGAVDKDLKELRELTKDNENQQKTLDELQPILVSRVAYAKNVV